MPDYVRLLFNFSLRMAEIKLDALEMGRYPLATPTETEQTAMIDTRALYAIFKSIIADKAKEEHKPTLSSLESMKAYQQATGSTQKASFNIDQANMVIDYV